MNIFYQQWSGGGGCGLGVLMKILLLFGQFSLVFGLFDESNARRQEREQKRRIRMSVMEFWDAEKGIKDGMELTWAHGVNNWPDLFYHIEDARRNRSNLIEGDVFLKRDDLPTSTSSAGPVMPMPYMQIPSTKSHSLTFKQWLIKAVEARKPLKINLMSSEVIKPALQYIFAYESLVSAPVIVHANIMKGLAKRTVQNGKYRLQEVIPSSNFLPEVSKLLPTAIIGVGWTHAQASSIIDLYRCGKIYDIRYTWRDTLDLLNMVYEYHQPIQVTVRAAFACRSYPQLTWLLGIRNSFSLLIKSEPLIHMSHGTTSRYDFLKEWEGLVALRKFTRPENLIYDLTPEDSEAFKMTYGDLSDRVSTSHSPWNREAWRVVQFINPSSLLSTIILSSSMGPAFVGWPTAFLLSQRPPASDRHERQIVSGRVLFVPKNNYKVDQKMETGLSIFLLNSITDISSPRLIYKSGVRVFIGFNGQISLQQTKPPTNATYRRRRRRKHRSSRMHRKNHQHQFNSIQDDAPKQTNPRRLRRRHIHYYSAHYQTSKTISQMVEHDCYAFSVSDGGDWVELEISAARCSGSVRRPPSYSWSRRLRLDNLPRSSKTDGYRQRFVLVQKTGDESLDAIVEDLVHSGAAAQRRSFPSFFFHHYWPSSSSKKSNSLLSCLLMTILSGLLLSTSGSWILFILMNLEL